MATVNVWETEGEVRCKASLRGKKYKGSSKVEFEFFRMPQNESAGKVEATMSGFGPLLKKAEATWTAPTLPETDAVQKYRYRLVIDGTPAADLPDDVFVWAREIEVTAKLADGNVAAGALIRCVLTDPPPTKGTEGQRAPATRLLRTNDQGVLKYRLPYPSALTTQVTKPWSLDTGGWTAPTARKRQVVVKRGFIASIEWPPRGEKPHRQWVNLPADVAKPELGPVVTVKIKPTRPADAEVGDKVWVTVTHTASNSPRTPQGNEKAPGTVENHELTLNGQKACTVDVTLMPSGADRVKISVGGTPSGDDAEVMVESWRKLFYGLVIPSQFNETQNEAKPDGNEVPSLPTTVRNALKAVLDPVGIEYALFDSVSANYAGYKVYPAAYFGKNGRDRVVLSGSDNGTGVPVAAPGNDDRTIRMQLCDLAVSSATTLNPVTVTASGLVTNVGYYRAFGEPVFLRSPRNGANALDVSGCVWTADTTGLIYDVSDPHPAFDAFGAPKTGAVDAAWFSAPNLATVRITFPPNSVPGQLVAPTGGATPVKVDVEFSLRTAYEINGNSDGLGQIMVFKPNAPKCMAATLCHELGHSFGMTIMPGKNKIPPGMPAAPHVDNGGSFYRNTLTGENAGAGGLRNCHKGGHCAHGLDGTLLDFSGLAGTCIMFGEGGDDDAKARVAFCPQCTKYVKARNLADLATSFETRPDADC